MQTLILADLHANRAALSAILLTPEARDCGSVVSLGDQFNYGPCPAECLAMLRAFCEEGGRSLTMLQGNHEERLPHLGEPALRGVNWALLRWSAEQIGDGLLGLPKDVRLMDGRVWCTHGTPGDPDHLVDEEGVRAVLDTLPDNCRLLLSGHNHIRWRVRHAGREAVNPGSAGMWEDSPGCTAPFGILQNRDDGSPSAALYTVPYREEDLLCDYLQSGCFRPDPVIPRIALTVMRTGSRHTMLHYIRHARRVAERMGGDMGEPAVWQAADASWPWADGLYSEAFWARLESEHRQLCK